MEDAISKLKKALESVGCDPTIAEDTTCTMQTAFLGPTRHDYRVAMIKLGLHRSPLYDLATGNGCSYGPITKEEFDLFVMAIERQSWLGRLSQPVQITLFTMAGIVGMSAWFALLRGIVS